MSVIPMAKPSPRIQDGTIAWYAGDAFIIDWEVHLEDDAGPITFQEGDQLIWSFFSVEDKTKPVHTFVFDYTGDENNTWIVELFFDRAISNKFAVGNYTYCVKFLSHDNRVVTLNANNKIKVEACH